MKKKMMFLICSILLVFSLAIPAFATEQAADVPAGAVLASEALFEPRVSFQEGTMLIQGQIYEQVSNADERFIYFFPVGKYDFELKPFLDNGYADARWRITLTNGDYIKGVSGEFDLWKDVIGLFNNHIDTAYVNEYYSYDAQLGARQSSEMLDLPASKINYQTAIIFEWNTFVVQGGSNDYFIPGGKQQGKLIDFPR